MNEALFLVDGYGLIYRAYFAFIHRPLLNPQGQNSSAVFGFFRTLFQLIRQMNPAYLAVLLDSPVPTFRHQRYPQYKATRDRAPQDLHAQVPVIEEILAALGIQCFHQDGFEADDLIATLAARCREKKRECYILSGDKDILQMVGQGVYMLHSPKGSDRMEPLGREEVFQQRGIYPEQVVDYLSLTGDASDNIPGVAGVGDKTALKLLGQYGSLEAIYQDLEAVKPEGLRKKLEEGRESASLSKELIILRQDVPLGADLESLRLQALNAEAAIPLFARQGMNSLVEELGGTVEAAQALKRLKPGAYETVLDEPALKRWLEEARLQGVFAFDTETTSLDELEAEVVGVSLAVAPAKACYIPLRAKDKAVLPGELVRDRLRDLLEDPKLLLIGQNIKYDYKVVKRWGITIKNRLFDTMVAAWVLDSEFFSYSMDDLAQHFLNYRTIHYDEVVGEDKTLTLAEVDLERATDYAAEDADITYQLYQGFSQSLGEQGLEQLFQELEMPLVVILADMELAGIRLDQKQLTRYGKELEGELAQIEREVYRLCGREFNIRSTKELQKVLFEERKLKPIKKTKTGYSTDTTVLAVLAQEDPVPGQVLRHRLLSKLKSTYVDALPQLVKDRTGRLHTHYRQTVAATGRLSSQDPNLQNIPVREEEGRRIRSAFIPRAGYSFLSADYSQIELAVLAHLSQDPMLIKAFGEGGDIHRQTAAIIFDIPEERVEPAQRRIGKTINFGVIYGMSSFRLARDLKIPRKEADDFIARYFERYAGVKRFIDATIRQAEERGYVETFRGRRRRIKQIGSRNRTEKMAAERVAVNSPIQGGAADIVKKAMIDLARVLDDPEEARLLLQVHDELIFEVRDDRIEHYRQSIRQAMEGAQPLSVDLKVSVETGKSWGEIH